ncbi:AMP-binding protein [Rhizobium sp. RU36D]|uniref:AMP-binding protein n=1 Tax=Rhizobium sp. RU36D TaxID=1907415 RepID=UPI0009D82DB0|nr:AMP-binding protein [Rhizobium sp. RU36D]SMC47063.1 Acyl-CoA synthetase (AMP-forming)/AMP-acid ligase II [Rhizobium sp. RU36D]
MLMLPSPYLAFERKALSKPDLPFLIAPASAGLPYAPDGFRLSYGEIFAMVESLRADFAAAGYGAGSRVALLLQNRPDFFVHWLALNAIGASIVPINPDMRPDELAFQIDVSKAQLIVAYPEFDGLVTAGTPDGFSRMHPGDAIPEAQPKRAAGGGGLQDECALLFTSGSTGKPKACILTNGYFMKLAEWYVTQGGIAAMLEDCEVALTPLPLFHMNALGCTTVGMIVMGGAVVPLDRFSASKWWQTVSDSGATIVHALGVIPAILLQLPEHPAERAHKARFVLGPGVDARHKTVFEERYGLPIVEAWAMTETGGAAVTSTARDVYEPGRRCIGRPRDGMDYRIVDDAGADVALGTPGELWVRAAGEDPRRGFFAGYLGDEKATEEAWAGGWFHTGDVVYADEAGLLYFFDRKKSIVRRSGENIAVLEVEAALMADPEVEAAAVTPVADDIRGEEVFAFVVPKRPVAEGEDMDRALALLAHASMRLSYHKLPGYVAFVEKLPVSSTQKLQRGVLRSEGQRLAEAGLSLDLRDRKAGFRTS